MTRARELYREGKLSEAIGSLQDYLRGQPSDPAARVFLFELLCFAGEFSRATRQLDALSGCAGDYDGLIRLYGAALQAEAVRQQSPPSVLAAGAAAPVRATVDGRECAGLTDADEALGPRLEIIGGTEFRRLPFCLISRIEIAPPKRLRDLYFLPARVETGPQLDNFSFVQVLIPCLYAGSFRHEDELLKLGRTTEWFGDDSGAVRPAGLRLLRAGEEEIAITDVRLIEFAANEASTAGQGK